MREWSAWTRMFHKMAGRVCPQRAAPLIVRRGGAENPVAAIPAESAALVLEANSEAELTGVRTPTPAIPALVVPGPDAPASGWRFMALGLVLLLLAIGLLRLVVKRSRPPQPSLISQSYDRERK